jgi:hypothetical protein
VTTYDDGTVHAGDIVLGHDGELWGVARIEREPELVVELVKHGARVVGRPPVGTPVTVVQQADVSAERDAVGALLASGLGIELISERWES